MNDELDQCPECGASEKEHAERHLETMTNYTALTLIAANAGPDFAEIAKNVLTEWRTHALRECDPLAIT